MASWRQGAPVSKSKTRSPGSSLAFQGKTPDPCPDPPRGPMDKGFLTAVPSVPSLLGLISSFFVSFFPHSF